MEPFTPPFVIGLVSVVSMFVLLPGIIVGAVLGNKALKIKALALSVREKELELEREKLSYTKVLEARQAIDRAGEITGTRVPGVEGRKAGN